VSFCSILTFFAVSLQVDASSPGKLCLISSYKIRSIRGVDLEKNAKDILDRVQTNDEVLQLETKTEKMVGTCVTPRLVTKESN